MLIYVVGKIDEMCLCLENVVKGFVLSGWMILRYNGLSAYGQSKLANLLHANELARHLKVHTDKVNSSMCLKIEFSDTSGKIILPDYTDISFQYAKFETIIQT